MTQTLVGLFLNPPQARKVAAELESMKVPKQQIEVLDAYVSALDERLQGAGIPKEDSTVYAEGVRRGGALVLAGVEGNLVDQASAVMDDHGAADIDDLAAGWSSGEEFSEAAPEPLAEARGPETEPGPQPSETGFDPLEEEISSASAAPVREDMPPAEEEESEEISQPLVPLPIDREFSGPNGGLHVQSAVIEKPVERTVPVLEEEVTVERRPADRLATNADFEAFEQGVVEFVELAEEVIVSKKARVVEEIVITKRVRGRSETVRDTLKQTHLTMAPRAQPDGGSTR